MSGNLCFVQFIHPGGEHQPDEGNTKHWNTGNHKRKFIKSKGRYLDDVVVREDEIVFWGEWEPESEVVQTIDSAGHGYPRKVFQPYYVSPGSKPWLQNTDPFVFGDQFHYTCCQQNTRRGPTRLRSLDRGSVILFGSCIGRQAFVVDTVFVVDRWIDYSLDDQEVLNGHISETYNEVTVSRLSPSFSYRLYFGATFEKPYHGMFSFFPCRPYGNANGFGRPRIEIPNVITDNLYQGRKVNRQSSIEDVVRLWNMARTQVVEQGLMLGISAELPEKRNADGSPWAEQAQGHRGKTASRAKC